MSGYILIAGIVLCFSCFILHVVVWRVRKPVHDVKMLIYIFLLLPFAIVSVFSINYPQWFQVEEIFLVIFLHYCLSLAYIASYPAAQAHSPSLDIMLKVSRSSNREISASELADTWRSRNVLIDRVDDLLTGGLIVRRGEIYSLTRTGEAMLAMYRLYRRFLGISFGKG